MDLLESAQLLNRLISFPQETEWLEFKHNFHSEEEIGKRLSALSNSAALLNKPFGYLVFGIEDGTHSIVGTTFKAKCHKKGNEELEMWLLNRLNPRIDIECFEFDVEGKHISMYRIPAATERPVTFLNIAYIRVGSLTKPLVGYSEKEAKLWRKNHYKALDKAIVKDCGNSSDIIRLLSAETYFDRLKIPMPQTTEGIIERFISEKFIVPSLAGYGITELGAMLLAKDLRNFDSLYRKAVRVIVYKGKDKVETVREKCFEQGYAVCLPMMIDWVNSQLPANEEIGKVLREDVRMYPEIAIREISANMIIHQDFSVLGFPMIEIYSDRVEISSPGRPLISTDRFIDEYQSRNEVFADIMRRMGFCEEKGSGMDKALTSIEKYQLPAIKYRVSDIRTAIILSAYKTWAETTKEERVQACYQHACLKYTASEMLTNKSLRERLGVDEKNYPLVSIVIREALAQGLIKVGTPEGTNRRDIAYIPIWG
ncbi:MAG: putative DNA binding domain-containing protein [Bacteroides sp.]|nr:putative DNA binding domain-containing protein [Bacteroides sp.]MCM1086031.1 putative DNA binding domain-containing protein [Bacteroides sp.]